MSADCHVGTLKASRPQTLTAIDANTDRRSPSRLRFVRGWRRTVAIGCDRGAGACAAADTPRVIVWVARTASLLRARSALKVLTDDDWAAFAQLRAEATRNSATAAKILLRLGLSQAVGRRVEPRDWQFQRTPLGKPLVSTAMPDVNFSVSHADAVTVVAACSSLNLGVDVELIDQDVAAGVLNGFCNPDERAALQNLSPYRRDREFIRIWTQKEAYTKLLGSGHSLEFSSIRCSGGAVVPGSESEAGSSVYFDNFFVSEGSSLYYVSLAIDAPRFDVGEIDIQLIDVVGPGRIKSKAGISVVV